MIRTARYIKFIDSAMSQDWKSRECSLEDGCCICYALGWEVGRDSERVLLSLCLSEDDSYTALRMSIPLKAILEEKVIKL